MIILHATFLEGEFFLWGEMPEEPETLAAKRPRNKSNLRGNPAHPKPLRYDAGIEKLSSGLKETSGNFGKKDEVRYVSFSSCRGNFFLKQ